MNPAVTEPKLDVSRSRDERKHICLKQASTEAVEEALQEILHTYFHDQLTISQSKVENKETKWIIKTRDAEYLYGFSIIFDGTKLTAGHPINTISIWMQELTQEAFAKKLGVNLLLSRTERAIEPDPEAIDTFHNWLYTRAKGQPRETIEEYYEYQSERLPDGLKQFEGHSITH